MPDVFVRGVSARINAPGIFVKHCDLIDSYSDAGPQIGRCV
jgi:hypothetical protein